ncbi:MAG: bile acid:sodium symporter family protein [Clostridia bacterium]|nr:bile acid:sodium symporter family protein [Clostridia bacterium]
MKALEKVSTFLGNHMAVLVLVVTAVSLFIPKAGLWIQTGWINYLLMIVMFGMGLTLNLSDFQLVFSRPRDILIGCVSQFTIMPLLAFALGKLFRLDDALLAGVILVGTCPGGTSSNVITYLSGGDVPLSVGMTSINTLLAPILTPALTYLFLHTTVEVNIISMFLSIIQVVILPIALGLIINRIWGQYTRRMTSILPSVSVIAISLIVASVVSHNAGKILSTGLIVFAVVILHNVLGYACGFGIGKLLKLDASKTKALSIEIGMQNSGLATALAGTAFPSLTMATVPGAIFSVWHNISGAILANLFRKH